MEYFPVPPASHNKTNHCVNHVLQKSFREVLHRPKFPENIAESAAHFRLDQKILKEEAETVNRVCKRKNYMLHRNYLYKI